MKRGAREKTKPLKNSIAKRIFDCLSLQSPRDVQLGAIIGFMATAGPRGGQELRGQQRRNFTYSIDEDGEKYIHFVENSSTKNESGGVRDWKRDPKIVKIYDVETITKKYNPYFWLDFYFNALPKGDGGKPLWINFLANFHPQTKIGYTNKGYNNSAHGHTWVENVTRMLCERINLEQSKQYSNHSWRAFMMSGLDQLGVPRPEILKQSGHAPNSSSANSYFHRPDAMEKEQCSGLFGAISKGVSCHRFKNENGQNQKIENTNLVPSTPTTTFSNCTFSFAQPQPIQNPQHLVLQQSLFQNMMTFQQQILQNSKQQHLELPNVTNTQTNIFNPKENF